MPTLYELERRNRQLKIQLENQRDLLEIERKRSQLLKESKSLSRQLKYGGMYRLGNSAWKKLSGAGVRAKRNIAVVMKNIERQRKINEARLKTARRSPVKRRPITRRIKRK